MRRSKHSSSPNVLIGLSKAAPQSHSTHWIEAALGAIFGTLGILSCAASGQPKGSIAPPDSSAERAPPPDPALERGPWHAPVPGPHSTSQLAWAATQTPPPCRAAVNTGPVARVDNEADFEALFCRSSDVDWQHLQLFWYRLAPTQRALATEDVVLNDSQIDWLLVPEPCSERGGLSTPPMPAIVIGRSDLPVVARPKPPLPADCPASGEGYGY